MESSALSDIDYQAVSLGVNHPLASFASLVACNGRGLQDLLDGAGDERAVQGEPVVGERLELLLAPGLDPRADSCEHNPIRPSSRARDCIDLAQLVAGHDVHSQTRFHGDQDLLPVLVRRSAPLVLAISNGAHDIILAIESTDAFAP